MKISLLNVPLPISKTTPHFQQRDFSTSPNCRKGRDGNIVILVMPFSLKLLNFFWCDNLLEHKENVNFYICLLTLQDAVLLVAFDQEQDEPYAVKDTARHKRFSVH